MNFLSELQTQPPPLLHLYHKRLSFLEQHKCGILRTPVLLRPRTPVLLRTPALLVWVEGDVFEGVDAAIWVGWVASVTGVVVLVTEHDTLLFFNPGPMMQSAFNL